MEFSVQQIAGMLNAELTGDGSVRVRMLAKIQNAQEGQLTFLSNPKYESYIYTTKASAVIVSKNFVPKKQVKAALLMVDDPYSSFTALLEEYHKIVSFQKTGVEQPSYAGEDCVLGEELYRGAFSYIGNRVKIGNRTKIFPHVYIGDDVVIGDNTILHPNVKIYSGTRIGSFCEIHSGAVIGSDGFGFAPQPDGSYKAIPQLGNVIIEDHVYIGANTTIDCATMLGDATLIKEGVKLDNLIQVAHNVEIGKHTVIAAQAGVSGSTRIGDNCIIAGQVGIAGHLVIANKTGIGAQAGIMKSVTGEGEKIMGSPAFRVNHYLQSYVVFKQLPELDRRLRELEQRVLPDASSNGKHK